MRLLYHNLAKGWEWGIFPLAISPSRTGVLNSPFYNYNLKLQLKTTPPLFDLKLRLRLSYTTRGDTPLGYSLRGNVPTNLKRGGVSTNLERDAEIDGDLADITVLVPVQHNGTPLLAIIDTQRD